MILYRDSEFYYISLKSIACFIFLNSQAANLAGFKLHILSPLW